MHSVSIWSSRQHLVVLLSFGGSLIIWSFGQEWDGDLNCLYLNVHGSPCRRNVFSLLYISVTIKAG
jgi:hypothetical protein